jgi:hypothetical protein
LLSTHTIWIDALGWTATGVFSCSYFFKSPAALRSIQAAAAALWVIYGVRIHSTPVVAANLIVGIAAVYTGARRADGRRAPGGSRSQSEQMSAQIHHGNEQS